MPKLTNRPPRYSHHKASGQAFVKFGGKYHYLGPYGSAKSKAEYKRVVAEFMLASLGHTSRLCDTSDLAVSEILVRYARFARGYYVKHGEPTKEVDNIAYAIRPLRLLYGRHLVRDFGPLALKALQAHLVEEGLARHTINSRIGIIKRIFRWAASEELCPAAISDALDKVNNLQAGRTKARETEPIRAVQDEVVEATLKFLPTVVSDMVRLQRLLGCRPNEICIMKPVSIDRGSDIWVYRPERHKTEHHGTERRIYVGPRAQAILRPYLLRDSENYCFSPVESEKLRKTLMRQARRTPVQPSQKQRAKARRKRPPADYYSRPAYGKAIRRACKRAGVDPWHPNQLRHAAGTEIRKRHGIEEARIILGHSKVSMTERYAKQDTDLGILVARQIG